jgi:hypothetical protein
MTRNIRLRWIADAEARHFAESALIQHGLSEPTIGVVTSGVDGGRRHWVLRLVARLTAAPQPELPPAPKVWPHGGLC